MRHRSIRRAPNGMRRGPGTAGCAGSGPFSPCGRGSGVSPGCPFRPAPRPTGESIAAGIAGEQQVALELGQVLGDDWVLFHGYRNRRGEIDHLLLGPRGLFAIEVKHRNATVYIAGDEWRYKKFDQWGNQVESGSIEDRTGQSPSVQV